MKKIFQYIMLAVVTIVMASCTSDIEETTATTGKSNVQLVVGEFPAFGDSQTRAIGTPDAGKTSWAEGDELLLEMTSKTLGTKYAAFKYNGSNWELASGELSYKEDEVPTLPHVYHAHEAADGHCRSIDLRARCVYDWIYTRQRHPAHHMGAALHRAELSCQPRRHPAGYPEHALHRHRNAADRAAARRVRGDLPQRVRREQEARFRHRIRG